jgi:hypothetical protein
VSNLLKPLDTTGTSVGRGAGRRGPTLWMSPVLETGGPRCHRSYSVVYANSSVVLKILFRDGGQLTVALESGPTLLWGQDQGCGSAFISSGSSMDPDLRL